MSLLRAVIFVAGIAIIPNWFIPKNFKTPIEDRIFWNFWKHGSGKLEGVVVTGGEPTIQKGLLDFLAKLKSMEYAVKLDTNGSNPGCFGFCH